MMNNLKKLIIPLLLLLALPVFAQEKGKPDPDKIKVLKIAFITERLNLNSTEAQAFWPLYNDHEKNREALRKKYYEEIHGKIKGVEKLSEKEAADLLEKYIELELKEERLDADFYKKVSKVISAKKAVLLLRSEEDFKRQLINQYRHRHGGQ